MGFGLGMGAFGQGLLNGALLQKRLQSGNAQKPPADAAAPGAVGAPPADQPAWKQWVQSLLGTAGPSPQGAPGASVYGSEYPNWMGPMSAPQAAQPGGNVASFFEREWARRQGVPGQSVYGAEYPRWIAPMQTQQAGPGNPSPNVSMPYSTAPRDPDNYGLQGVPGLNPRFYSGRAPDFDAAVRNSLSWANRYPSPTTQPWYNQPSNRYLEPPQKPPANGGNGGGNGNGNGNGNGAPGISGPFDENGNLTGWLFPGGG